MSAEAIAAVERMFAAANRGDYQAADDIFAPDFHNRQMI